MTLQKPISISKKKQNSEFEYETLRKQGIQFVQELCGKDWTDFNPHDPGVTILEQIVFALSELGYKTTFDIKDYLAEDGGRISYNAEALFPPESVFPGSPVTSADYAKFLFANIPEIENISVEYNAEKGYSVRIVPVDVENDAKEKNLVEKRLRNRVEALWAEWRNFGEVIDVIEFDWKKKCYLEGIVEITGMRPAADILFDIYVLCSDYFGSKVKVGRYNGQLLKDLSLEQIFDGPLSTVGFLGAEKFDSVDMPVLFSELENIIQKISGISRVRDLSLTDFTGCKLKDIGRSHLQLDVENDSPHIKLFFGGRNVFPQNFALLKKIRARISKRPQLERMPVPLKALRELLPELPTGNRPDILGFSSIADQFPSLYGSGACSLQLQNYLSPIEYIFKSFLQKIDGFCGLYSVQSDPSDLKRCNFVLNQMLALYGFCFPDALFLTLRGLPADSVSLELIHAKQSYLRNLPVLSKQRSGDRWLHRIEMMIGVDLESQAPDVAPLLVDGVYLDGSSGCIFIVWPKKAPFMDLESNRVEMEEFIRDELPAHLVPYIYWVGDDAMRSFRMSYFRWNSSLREHKNASGELLAWFRSHANFLSGGFWL